MYEYGWHGVNWVYYFHNAIPLSILMMIIWCNAQVKCKFFTRLSLNVIGLIFIILVYLLLYEALVYRFICGPRAFFLLHESKEKIVLMRFLVYFLPVFIPIGIAIFLYLFKIRIHVWVICISALFVLLGTVFSPYFIRWIELKGKVDFIHVFKSGIIYPFWVIGNGIIFFGIKSKKEVTQNKIT